MTCETTLAATSASRIAKTYSAITFKHLLLPVWISAYRFQSRVYQALVNAHG
jgi:hypothetical protein